MPSRFLTVNNGRGAADNTARKQGRPEFLHAKRARLFNYRPSHMTETSGRNFVMPRIPCARVYNLGENAGDSRLMWEIMWEHVVMAQKICPKSK